ncbi:unnamed protein product [Euphydryas editha]|uniref:Uncharacterized protein n=1 Tax=Euphydryas editha TaxID=104508 RepID=A0AAU9UAR1_EUPED|nr:unnamed protein product [Euphydryas editha]
MWAYNFISATDEIFVSKARSSRHILPLLGYLQGYKIGQNFALQLPPFVLSPIIIVPSVNQQQSVNVQKSSSGESYQENGETFQNISPVKLIDKSNDYQIGHKELNQSLKPKTTKNIENATFDKNNSLDTFRQANNEPEVTATEENIDEYLTTTTYFETSGSEFNNSMIENITNLPGPYVNAIYNNTNLSTLSITTAPLEYNLSVPDAKDRWQNFSNPSNEFVKNTKNITMDNNSTSIENIIFKPSRELTYTTYQPNLNSYPRSWYNSKVDRLSITTNSYTNEDPALPPSYNDRWERFSSLRKSYPLSDFRPLAGLYYDGFLHKPLNKEMGFMPYRNNGYYYNG